MSDIENFWRFNNNKRHTLNNLGQNIGNNDFRSLEKKFCIACTARSGSSFLTVALERYNLNVDEYFNSHGFIKTVHEKYNIDTVNEFVSYLVKFHSPNKIFGVKAPYTAVQLFHALGELPQFANEWKVVYLKRNNLLQQAISAYIASMTNQWTHVMQSNYYIKEDDYDFNKILVLIDSFARQNENWERFFSLLNITPYRISYESLIKEPVIEIENIAKFIGINPQEFPESHNHVPWIQKQANQINHMWEERFIEEISVNKMI